MKSILIFLLVLRLLPVMSQNSDPSEIRNVILLIPDGTSADLITLSRWFNNNRPLAVDEIICGLVKTHSIDNRFPDSAPTSTAYATGVKSVSGYIGVDSSGSPQITVMELARLKGLATGIVVTCEYPHATPADFVCHFPDRRNYNILTGQFLNNSPDIVFAGGKGMLERANNGQSLIDFHNAGYRLITNKEAFERLTYQKDSIVWALFADWKGDTEYKSYQCDIENQAKEPSLSEMTAKAIEMLSQNKQGFLLVVEGSQIDWACHNNDPYAAVTEFLEFDKAVGKALDFAGSNRSTAVIVCPDHGNGGLSIGNVQSHTSFITKNQSQYDKIDIPEKIIAPLKEIRCSARKLTEWMLSDSGYINPDTLKQYYHITDPLIALKIKQLLKTFPAKSLSDTIQFLLGSSYSAANFIGWTSTGHTAEDVFLGAYIPEGHEKISGVIDNTQIAHYISGFLKLGNLMDSTKKYFCRTEILLDDDKAINSMVTPDSLVIQKKSTQMTVYANTRDFTIQSPGSSVKKHILPTLAVRIDDRKKNPVYYLPKTLYLYL
jgi:alkaline phosphatase